MMSAKGKNHIARDCEERVIQIGSFSQFLFLWLNFMEVELT